MVLGRQAENYHTMQRADEAPADRRMRIDKVQSAVLLAFACRQRRIWQDRNRVDLNEEAMMEFGNGHYSARRACFKERCGINRIEARPVLDADNVRGYPHQPLRRTTSCREDCVHVIDCLLGLCLKAVIGQ